MKNTSIKIIIIITLIIIILIFVPCNIENFSDTTPLYEIVPLLESGKDGLCSSMSHINKVYCINLDFSTDRYENIRKFENEVDVGISRFPAIDTRTYEQSSTYFNLLTNTAVEKLKKLYTNKVRNHHNELTFGAIGCYLTHYNIWKDAIKNKYKYILILEDDAKLYKGFYKKIINILNNVPDNWDIILFGLVGIGTKINEEFDIYKVDFFTKMHCYLVKVESLAKIINKIIPIDIQLDWAISKFTSDINVYGCNIILQNRQFETTIQFPLFDNRPFFSDIPEISYSTNQTLIIHK